MKIRLDKWDRLFAEVIKLRDEDTCQWCGIKDNKKRDTSHFHSRRKFSTRYDPDNACRLHKSCHDFFHAHPNIHVEFWQKRLGSKRYEELNVRANLILKRTKANEEAIRADLQKQIKILGGE